MWVPQNDSRYVCVRPRILHPPLERSNRPENVVCDISDTVVDPITLKIVFFLTH